MIPLVHDFDGEVVLVFGGGAVGARKARRFAREARVVVVSPDFADADFGASEFVRAAPDPDDVGAWLDAAAPALVVAATDDDALNAAVASVARERGILVNRADRSGERESGSVVVPATVDDGPVTVAVTTSGTSPAVSRHLRRELESVVDGAGVVATVVGDLRGELKERGVDPERRREAIRAAAADRVVWSAAKGSGDADRVRKAAARTVEEVLDGGDE
ncbi:precorrin-2 dehydrogenase/sirohydrochlorin ferrochelatase family protein [Haloplanus aerogenes]|uniref:precorrin-2 dehydrogenase n=1 Tax=Haloplanus aerogenes TaxID=660522 RepID=A0A3M0CWL6_9EURY|nr:bifunctional precorrin-2 dehydrogenase/sirohydrochlorin ferrochelatase [Haloplanus aerogenes]AZH24007.1 bifunctional precorrin-2 dehydrogenase/sirohydrochlorin ferrochelatase [Haloplanus aerogenes]RMB13225.1 precorrin-2 dehydrogenase/sirohydrochlorin ferrochelatase [Haloplanus aerogenes]